MALRGDLDEDWNHRHCPLDVRGYAMVIRAVPQPAGIRLLKATVEPTS
jgi:hypothetical protein